MLKSIDIENFTVFAQPELQFSPQLNVVVGENASGKSHLLKLMCSVLAASAEQGRGVNPAPLTKSVLQTRLAEKLVAVLRPESLGRLARRQQGRARSEVRIRFDTPDLNLDFSFATQSRSEVTIDHPPSAWVPQHPVFLPTRELLTIYPGFTSLYASRFLEFEETWRDTCLLLGLPLARGPRQHRIDDLLAPLEGAMGGKVVLDNNGRFYLKSPGQGTMEMSLVAEGIRKLAMLAYLIANGSLLDKGYLFWDEPEANLNPKLVKDVAITILHLCRSGIQVFIATHSMFLLRELHIQLQTPEFQDTDAQFFGLQNRKLYGVSVTPGESLDNIGEIVALDEELSQSDRYLNVEASADVNDH